MIHRKQDNLTLRAGQKFSCTQILTVGHEIQALAQWKESTCLQESYVKYKKRSPDITNMCSFQSTVLFKHFQMCKCHRSQISDPHFRSGTVEYCALLTSDCDSCVHWTPEFSRIPLFLVSRQTLQDLANPVCLQVHFYESSQLEVFKCLALQVKDRFLRLLLSDPL